MNYFSWRTFQKFISWPVKLSAQEYFQEILYWTLLMSTSLEHASPTQCTTNFVSGTFTRCPLFLWTTVLPSLYSVVHTLDALARTDDRGCLEFLHETNRCGVAKRFITLSFRIVYKQLWKFHQTIIRSLQYSVGIAHASILRTATTTLAIGVLCTMQIPWLHSKHLY